VIVSSASTAPGAGTEAVVVLVKEGPRALRIRMQGRVKTEDAKLMLRDLAFSLRASPCYTFWDLGELESYESGVRVESTRVLLEEWKNVLSVRVYARSQLVRMGVAVANLALKNRVETFSDRATFEASIRQASREG
jgi:hypothetical protein